MSIKTLRKRIALVAVSALGVGLLSVASITPASAAVTADDIVVGTNTQLGMCANTTASGVDSAVIPLTSTGLVIGTSGATDGDVAAGNDGYVTLSGPGIFSALGSAWTALSQTIASTTSLAASTSANNDLTVKPTATGTIKVTYSPGSTSAAVDVITITVVEKCANLALSLALSKFVIVSETTAQSATALPSGVLDNSDAAVVAEGDNGYIRMALADTYGSTLSSSKALIATVSGANCLVNLQARAGSYTAGTGTTAVLAANGSDHVVVVSQADSDIPASCTTTVTYDGTTVGSKTLTFRGIPTKVEVSDVVIGRNSATTGSGRGFYRVTVSDAAGNLLPGVEISASSTEANNAAALASGVITAVQAQSGALTSSTSTSLGKTAPITATTIADAAAASGATHFTCGAVGGTAKLTVRAVIDAATASYATSAPFNVACSGSLDTWSISLDKATYAPGEIATLTLSGKDSKGRPVSTFTLLSGVAYSFGGMTAVTAPTNNDAFNSGVGTKTYQFSVGTSEGSFVGTFTTTGSTDTSAKTVQYKVANQSATVTTNEVLAAIVKLIATINKQIRQLQKQLRR